MDKGSYSVVLGADVESVTMRKLVHLSDLHYPDFIDEETNDTPYCSEDDML
jgi:hypothetical protein